MPASNMDNLEDLPNDQLRLRLLEYGLANMPVTTTTRGVLIRKLRNVMKGAETKTRRETIHVTKYSSGEESEADAAAVAATKKPAKPAATNRRATIAAAAPPPPKAVPIPLAKPIAPAPVAAAKPINTRRSSGRKTPNIEPASKPQPVSIAPNIIDIEEDSDEGPVYTPSKQQRNKSRSPSLAKSDTVTTSYKHTTANALPSEIIIEDEFEEEELESSVDAEIIKYTNTRNVQYRNSPNKNLYPEQPTIRHSTAAAYINDIHRDSPSKSTKHASISTSFNPYNVDTQQRRYTMSNAYQSSYAPSKTDYVDDEDVDMLEEEETPYLSEFTRRLSRLRAEPLANDNTAKVRRDLGLTGDNAYAYRTSDHIHGRSALPKTDTSDTIWASFVTLLKAFEQRYRWYIIAVVVSFVALFIWVMLFTPVN